DALALAAGKFVRVALGGRRVEPDFGERLLNEPPPLRLAGAQIVDAQPLADDLRDRQPRRQARIGILKNHLHLAPQRTQPPLRLLRDVTPPEADRALGIEQPQQRETQRRLARAALADDPQRRAGAHLERDAVDRLHIALDAAKDAAADRKPYLDVIALDQDRRRR